MGRAEPLGWDDLWKVFEIIREAVKPDTIVTLGWTNAADLDSFKESANQPDVSGDEARHARRLGQPQHRKMSLARRPFVRERSCHQVVGLARWQLIRNARTAPRFRAADQSRNPDLALHRPAEIHVDARRSSLAFLTR